MKLIFGLSVVLLCGVSYSQTKTRTVKEGLPCEVVNWGEITTSEKADDKNGTHWILPHGQIWECQSGKWIHNVAEEQEQLKHFALVGYVRSVMTKRKLNEDEMKVAFEAAYQEWAITGNDFEKKACEAEEVRTNYLIAQLSFWPHTESELPIKDLLQYMPTCELGGQSAHEILNNRIYDWLMNQFKPKRTPPAIWDDEQEPR